MSLFTENDIRLLDKTLVIREQLIDNLMKEKLPTQARDLEVFTGLLESVDRSILAKAKIKIDESATKTNEETKHILRSLLLELHTNSEEALKTPAGSFREVPEYQPRKLHIHEGELIPKVDNIDVKAILSEQ